MKHKIALVESDTQFAANLSMRLQKLLPSSSFLLYSPDSLRENRELRFSEDVVLYNSTETTEDELNTHIAASNSVPLIPIQETQSASELPLGGKELSVKISDALASTALEIQNQKNARNKMVCVVSFIATEERETYLRKQLNPLFALRKQIIRLDIMQGISMPVYTFPPKQGQGARRTPLFSGISQLLFTLEEKQLQPKQIWEYLQLETNGLWTFGPPHRSDDLLCAPSSLLIQLLLLLRKATEDAEESTESFCVMEGLPFRTLTELCPIFDELHLLVPQSVSKSSHYNFEMNALLRKMPAESLRFIYQSRGNTYA